MSTFGADLIQSPHGSARPCQGRRARHRPRSHDAVRGAEAGEAHAGPDGAADGHEPLRLSEMGAGHAAGQRPGRDTAAHD